MSDSFKHDKKIQIIARWLARGDQFLAEELRSEMHIAILNIQQPCPDEFFCLHVAKCDAIDFLRSKAHNYSHKNVFRHCSLEALEEAGLQVDTERNIYLPPEERYVYLRKDTQV